MLVRDLLTDKNNTTLLNDKDRERLAFLGSEFQYSPIGGPAVSPRRYALRQCRHIMIILSLFL